MAESKTVAPAGANASANEPTETNEPISKLDSIECTVKKPFYSKEGAMMNEGQPYVFSYDEQNPVFPWPILSPNDTTLHKSLKAEYDGFKKDKLGKIGRVAERNQLLARLAEIGVEG